MSGENKFMRDDEWQDPDPLLTVPEVADFFRIGNRFVRKLLRSGEMKGYFFGDSEWLVEDSAVNDYLETNTLRQRLDQEGPEGLF